VRERESTNGRSPARGLEELAVAEDEAAWRSRTRVVLTPLSAPSIMGLFGFMGATLMVGAWQAGWYGGTTTPLILFPFAMVFGGLAQLVAAFYSFRARDGVGVAAHSTWGSFWIGWGILQLLIATHVLPAITFGSTNTSFAFWFVSLGAITISAALAATGRNMAIALVLWTLAAGASLTAVGFFTGSLTIDRVGGWLFVISAGLAWYTATAMTMSASTGRTILPLGDYNAKSNVPGRRPAEPLEYEPGMPGVRVGQ
jgi:succinate-acetate transporter protein